MNNTPQTKTSGAGGTWGTARMAVLSLFVAAATALSAPTIASAAETSAHTVPSGHSRGVALSGQELTHRTVASTALGQVEIGAVDGAAIAVALRSDGGGGAASDDVESSDPEIYGPVLGGGLPATGEQLSTGLAAAILLAVCGGSLLVLARRRYHRPEVR